MSDVIMKFDNKTLDHHIIISDLNTDFSLCGKDFSSPDSEEELSSEYLITCETCVNKLKEWLKTF